MTDNGNGTKERKESTMKKATNAEFNAMRRIEGILEPLDVHARSRVMSWLNARNCELANEGVRDMEAIPDWQSPTQKAIAAATRT